MRIQQVLLNLLSNAIKFSLDFLDVKVTVKTSINYDQSVKVAVTVSDSGIGMNETDVQNLFQPYFRTSNE
jgi:signal transduction histidine kinase